MSTSWNEGDDADPTVELPVLSGPPDFHATNHGSIVISHALSGAARGWVDAHLPNDAMAWGTNGTLVEPRYIADIVEGIRADGLEVRT